MKIWPQKTVLIRRRSGRTGWQRGALYLVRALPAVTGTLCRSVSVIYLLSFLIEKAQLWAQGAFSAAEQQYSDEMAAKCNSSNYGTILKCFLQFNLNGRLVVCSCC